MICILKYANFKLTWQFIKKKKTNDRQIDMRSSTESGWWVYWSPNVAITNYNKFIAFKQLKFWRSKI